MRHFDRRIVGFLRKIDSFCACKFNLICLNILNKDMDECFLKSLIFLLDFGIDGIGMELIMSKTSSDVFNGKIFQL